MGSSKSFTLIINASFRSQALCDLQQAHFRLFAEIANYVSNFCNFFFADFQQVFNEPLYNWFACNRYQWLWNRQRMRSHPLTDTSHWDDYLHFKKLAYSRDEI